MGSLKTMSDGTTTVFLNPDELGDAGDVLTRVGAAGAEFKPGGGGGNPFDQDLNTDDAVQFASMKLGTGPFSATGDMRVGATFALKAWGEFSDAQFLSFAAESAVLGNESGSGISAVTVAAPNVAMLAVASDVVRGQISISNDNIDIFTLDGRPINLAPDGALNINGTPGVTAGPFTTITSITVTKGIITDLQGS